MKETDINLTIQEAEELCRLYMDCKLTALEETELEYVLGRLPFSSPQIEETRALMGIATLSSRKTVAAHPKSQRIRWRAVRIAAAIAILATATVAIFWRPAPTHDDTEDIYISYIDGQPLYGAQAKYVALEQMETATEIFDMMNQIVLTQEIEYENFNREITHYQ